MTNDRTSSPTAASTGSDRSISQPRRAAEILLSRDVTEPPDPASQQAVPGFGGSPKVRLMILSFLMLFVELALIRWLGANIVYLSYYSNFVLLGSFLGIGLGFLRARSRVNLFPWAPLALTLLVLFVLVFPVQISHTSGTQLIFFGALKTTGLPTWLTLPIIFLSVAAVMAMIGEGVARTFIEFKPLDAYRLDIVGSIVGIPAFSVLSFLDAKPLAWRRDHRVLGPVFPRRQAAGLGNRRCCCPVRALRQADRRGSGRRAAEPGRNAHDPELHLQGPLVALLPHHGGRQDEDRHHPDPGERDSAPVHHRRRQAASHLLRSVSGSGAQSAQQCPDHRRGHRERRGRRSSRGSQARRRGGDRPADLQTRHRAQLRRAVQEPAGHCLRQRWQGVPLPDLEEVRPDPLRSARLTDPGRWPVIAAAGELPVHAGGDAGGPGAPRTRPWRLRYVQLLPDAVAQGPAGQHAGCGLRPRALLQQCT